MVDRIQGRGDLREDKMTLITFEGGSVGKTESRCNEIGHMTEA